MRLFWNNYIDAAATTITSQSEQSGLPDDNVAHQHKGKVYRTGTSATGEWIKFDLGSARAVDGFLLLNHTLDNTETGVNIEGHASDDFSSPTFSEAVTVNAVDPAGGKFSSAQTYQWWRFEFTKASAGTARDLGRIFLGDIYDTPEPPHGTGYRDDTDDDSPMQRSIGGQTFSQIKEPILTLRTSFRSISLAMALQLQTIYDTLGTHTPLFVQVDPNASDGVRELIHYVKFTGKFVRKVSGFDSELKWDVDLEFETQL